MHFVNIELYNWLLMVYEENPFYILKPVAKGSSLLG